MHTEQELQTALDARSEIIGINNRDLKTFEVSLDVSIELSKFIPDDIIVVGESGISNKEDIKRLNEAGIETFLIGETLMKDKNPGEKLRSLIY